MLNIILFGPPGSGKGTQSAKLADQYRLVHLSTGDILRDEKRKQSHLGREAKKYIDQGLLVPDEVVIQMLAKWIDQNVRKGCRGFIFDGFPRTIAQAEALDRMMEERNMQVDIVFSLEVGKQELVTRLSERGKISGRVDDQDEATIQKRIDVYHDETAPVAGYYKSQGKLVKVKGEGTIDVIAGQLNSHIEQLQEETR